MACPLPALAPLQRVIDYALKDVLSCGSSYCRKATYKELRIDCVAMRAAKLRTRALLKLKASRTTIGELLNQSFKCSSATWITGTKHWLHRLLHCEIPATQHEAIRAVKSKMAERLSHTDRSVISKFKRVNLINSPLPSWKVVVFNPAIYSGWAALIKMRIGAFMYAYHLAEYGAIARYTGENAHFARRRKRKLHGISYGDAHDKPNLGQDSLAG